MKKVLVACTAAVALAACGSSSSKPAAPARASAAPRYVEIATFTGQISESGEVSFRTETTEEWFRLTHAPGAVYGSGAGGAVTLSNNGTVVQSTCVNGLGGVVGGAGSGGPAIEVPVKMTWTGGSSAPGTRTTLQYVFAQITSVTPSVDTACDDDGLPWSADPAIGVPEADMGTVTSYGTWFYGAVPAAPEFATAFTPWRFRKATAGLSTFSGRVVGLANPSTEYYGIAGFAPSTDTVWGISGTVVAAGANMAIADAGNNRVQLIRAVDGVPLTAGPTLAPAGKRIRSLAYDAAAARLYASYFDPAVVDTGVVLVLDPTTLNLVGAGSGGNTWTLPAGCDPRSLAVDTSAVNGGEVWVLCGGFSSAAGLVRIPKGSASGAKSISVPLQAADRPHSIVYRSDFIYFSEILGGDPASPGGSNGRVAKISTGAGGTVADVFVNLALPIPFGAGPTYLSAPPANDPGALWFTTYGGEIGRVALSNGAVTQFPGFGQALPLPLMEIFPGAGSGGDGDLFVVGQSASENLIAHVYVSDCAAGGPKCGGIRGEYEPYSDGVFVWGAAQDTQASPRLWLMKGSVDLAGTTCIGSTCGYMRIDYR